MQLNPRSFKTYARNIHFLCQALLLAGVITFAACSGRYSDMPAFWPIPTKDYVNYGPGRFKTGYISEQIDHFYRGSNPGPIGVTTFVNVDDLYNTSTFGRMYSEQLMSELVMKGFDVVEMRHSDALQFLNDAGEFALSRDVRNVKPVRDLSGVVVGTYVVSPERVYVNARLIDPSTSMVLSAGSVEMPKTVELAKLLRGGSLPQSLERIPVKHLGYAAYPAYGPNPMQRNDWNAEEDEWTAPTAQRIAKGPRPQVKPEVDNKPVIEPELSKDSKVQAEGK